MNKYKVCVEWWEITEVIAENEQSALDAIAARLDPKVPSRVSIVKEIAATEPIVEKEYE